MSLLSLRRRYKSCSKIHKKERLKRKALRRPRKTDIEGVDVTYMLGQTVSSTGSSYREGPITDGGQLCMTDIQWQWKSRLKASLQGLEISRVLELIGEIRWCCPMQTLVHKNSKLELNPLRCSQPVQLEEERSDVVVPWRREHESRSEDSDCSHAKWLHVLLCFLHSVAAILWESWGPVTRTDSPLSGSGPPPFTAMLLCDVWPVIRSINACINVDFIRLFGCTNCIKMFGSGWAGRKEDWRRERGDLRLRPPFWLIAATVYIKLHYMRCMYGYVSCDHSFS